MCSDSNNSDNNTNEHMQVVEALMSPDLYGCDEMLQNLHPGD